MKRPLCKTCRNKPRAYAYKKGKTIYWRSQCDTCIRKKKRCELCGFKQASSAQMDVYHVDGNRANISAYNLKTICANCQRLKSTQNLGWSLGDLEVDD